MTPSKRRHELADRDVNRNPRPLCPEVHRGFGLLEVDHFLLSTILGFLLHVFPP